MFHFSPSESEQDSPLSESEQDFDTSKVSRLSKAINIQSNQLCEGNLVQLFEDDVEIFSKLDITASLDRGIADGIRKKINFLLQAFSTEEILQLPIDCFDTIAQQIKLFRLKLDKVATGRLENIKSETDDLELPEEFYVRINLIIKASKKSKNDSGRFEPIVV